jgi:hypothetical protein
MNQFGLYIICGIILMIGLGVFLRAYLLGNKSMQKIHKDANDRRKLSQ